MRRFLYIFSVVFLGADCVFRRRFFLPNPKKCVIVQDEGEWKLLVNHKRFFIKGVGCQQATGEKGEDYLRMAHDMGANAVRTWGGAPRSYLDRAKKNDLMVDLGIWINPIRETGGKESYQDAGVPPDAAPPNSQIRARHERPSRAFDVEHRQRSVRLYRRSQGKSRARPFLTQIVKEIHLEDPNHPVIYSCSADRDLADVEKYVTNLDAIGTNVYGSLSPVLAWMRNNGKEKPVIVTEFGPLGSWDCPKDKNGVAYDPMDHVKSNDYASIWRQIEDAKIKCLGGFAFVLGEPRNQDSLTWYNINQGELKRDSFWTLYKAYTERLPSNRPPKFSEMHINKTTQLDAGPAHRSLGQGDGSGQG